MPLRSLQLVVLTLSLLNFCHPVWSQGPPINKVVVFGDSLCDTGNLYQVTQGGFPFGGPAPLFPIAFYPEGRFSNGPIWIETFAPAAGFATPQKFTTTPGGTNFAFGGAQTGIGDSLRLTPNVGTQIGFFAAIQGGFGGNELIVLWAGSNDFTPIPPAALPTPQQVIANMKSRITELKQLGGKYFLVPNVPAIGSTPQGLAQGPLVSLLLNVTVLQYNYLLNDALIDLERDLNITIFRVDTNRLGERASHFPQQFGLTNVTEPAFDLSSLTVVPNPNEYLYWDTEHPTSYTHAIIGKVAANAYLIGSMKATFASNQSWGIDVSGWFGRLQEYGLVSRLNIAKFYLDNGQLAAAAYWLTNFRSKVNSLATQGRLSGTDADWLKAQATNGVNCLESIQN